MPIWVGVANFEHTVFCMNPASSTVLLSSQSVDYPTKPIANARLDSHSRVPTWIQIASFKLAVLNVQSLLSYAASRRRHPVESPIAEERLWMHMRTSPGFEQQS
jgi:hypothetical protein